MAKGTSVLVSGAISFALSLFGIGVSNPSSLSMLTPLGEWVKSQLVKLPTVGPYLGGLETKYVVAGVFFVGLWIFSSWLIHVLGSASGLIIGIVIGIILLLFWSGMIWQWLPHISVPALPTNSTTTTGG